MLMILQILSPTNFHLILGLSAIQWKQHRAYCPASGVLCTFNCRYQLPSKQEPAQASESVRHARRQKSLRMVAHQHLTLYSCHTLVLLYACSFSSITDTPYSHSHDHSD